MTEGSTKAILAAFGANLLVSIAKFIGFSITGATSMLAEAIHSVADTSNQGLLLLGANALGEKQPQTTHSDLGDLGTSTPSLSRSCCSRSAGCLRSSKEMRSSSTQTR